MAISTPISTQRFVQKTFSRRELIPSSDNVLWRIEHGVVRTMSWNHTGTVIILGYWSAGEIIGQPLSRVQPYQIEALTPVTVTQLPTHAWLDAVETLFSRARQSEELLHIIRQDKVSDRLMLLLGWLARKFGRPVELGQLIDVRLTHQDLADTIGTSRVTMTRSINQFESEGILHRPRPSYIIWNEREAERKMAIA